MIKSKGEVILCFEKENSLDLTDVQREFYEVLFGRNGPGLFVKVFQSTCLFAVKMEV